MAGERQRARHRTAPQRPPHPAHERREEDDAPLAEISTGQQSIRQGDENLALSDTFGGNAFLPVLFLVAGLISGKAVLPVAQASDISLTAIAILLSVVDAVGLILRPKRRVLGMGVDSLAVLVLHLVGVAGLFGIAR